LLSSLDSTVSYTLNSITLPCHLRNHSGTIKGAIGFATSYSSFVEPSLISLLKVLTDWSLWWGNCCFFSNHEKTTVTHLSVPGMLENSPPESDLAPQIK